MTDFMTLHASAYPPPSWSFLGNRQLEPSQTSKNKLWAEMTKHYERSMAKQQHLITSNLLSETATSDNISSMSPDTKRRYYKAVEIAFKDAADARDVLTTAEAFVQAVDKLSECPLETIPEEDEFSATHSPRQQTGKETVQIMYAIDDMEAYERLKDSDEIESSFRERLMEINSTCYGFVCTPVGNHPRPRFAQICRMNREVTAHVARVRQQLTFEVAELRNFLRGRLFDQYCLMRDTPMEKKNTTWLEYGKCVVLGYQNRDLQVARRLDRLIDESGLDPEWVKEQLEDYYDGNNIGQWQRHMQCRRWKKLAAQLTIDIQQLEKINSTRSTNGRRCNIKFNICSTIRQFFKRLDGARDFELSEKASKMDEEDEGSSASSSTGSLVAVR